MASQKQHTPLTTLACNLDTSILQATLPLLESAKVEAIEWSFDALFQMEQIPDWFRQLLQAFSDENRLIGHGIFFSLFAGKWAPEQQQWLEKLAALVKVLPLDHVTEHFGFMTGANFHKGAPLGIPYTTSTLSIGQDRLKRIVNAAQCPVGLENLAFAYSADEVKRHGDFLSQLLAPVNGFIILDLHNLYCQMHNFGMSKEAILALYPLEQVREIHISGGSWESTQITPDKEVRRDTHDNEVPLVVFELLAHVLPLCTNLKYVVLEQLGTALRTAKEQAQYQQDYDKMRAITQQFRKNQASNTSLKAFLVDQQFDLSAPISDDVLWQQQLTLSTILETAKTYEEARIRLSDSCLANTAWAIENWQPNMLETALSIAQKWQ